MNIKTLEQLYAEHVGKVSDRWSIYLGEYDRIFENYRNTSVRLLEIGIQNGGSLEIWSKYFPNAHKLVGCDINPACAHLSYEDPRIAVVVGDVNSSMARAKILSYASTFDVIIDDGSHRSSDIVKSFAMYFPNLTDRGVYVAEDMHCSYWQEFEGGLFDPFSSVTFFKRLADIISHEHWGIEKARAGILSGFFAKYDFTIDEQTLQHVHSIEFINSMCVIRKAKPEHNKLGTRFISGSLEMVVKGHLELQGLQSSPSPALDQVNNKWTNRPMPPEEELSVRLQELAERDVQIADLNRVISERETQITNMNQISLERQAQITNLNQAVAERAAQIANLNQAVSERVEQIAYLHRVITAYQHSTSWRVMMPMRMIGQQIKSIKRVLIFSRSLLSSRNELKGIIIRAIRIYQREGLAGVGHRLNFLQSDRYAKHIADYGGLSAEFLGRLKKFASLLLRLERWWFKSNLRGEISSRTLGFLRGEPEAWRKRAQGSLRVHVDTPRIGLANIVNESCVVSGWAIDLETRSAAKVKIVVGDATHYPHPKQRDDVQRAFSAAHELPLDTGFDTVLTLPIGIHRMQIQVEGADGSWICVRRALLLRTPLSRTQRMVRLSYSNWMHLEQELLKAAHPDISRHIDVMLRKPSFTVVVDARPGIVGINDTMHSLREQFYAYCDVRVLISADCEVVSALPDDVEILNDMSLSDIRGEFIVFMQSGQRLAINALYEFAAAINQYPDIDLIYGDEDFCTASGSRCNPFHKPGWSPDYLETFNYIGFPACFRSSIARGCFDSAHVYDFVLRFTERTTKVLNVGKILGHGTERLVTEKTVSAEAVALDIAALAGRLSRTGRRGSVREHVLHKGCYDIRLDLKRFPLVSVVIPTAGKTVRLGERAIDLIENVIVQIRDRSTYKNIEIIVVDNGDLSPNQMRVLAEAKCKRITYSDSIFNISKKLNLGVSIASGEMLLLMNDDIEILTPSWIERLLEHFEKPHVGVVGAKLLYPDEWTQHVGVVHNLGNPDHVRRRFPRDDAGYFFSTCCARNYSAITGACMMTPASIYREVKGYSHELAVSYNDVDYCLKVRRKGLWVVYAPTVELIHMESQSRIASADVREVAWYHRQWAAEIVSDEFYNERFLTIAPPTFEPCINQRMV